MNHRAVILVTGAILALTAPASGSALGGFPGDLAGRTGTPRALASVQLSQQLVVPDLLRGQRLVRMHRPRTDANAGVAAQIDAALVNKAAMADRWRWFLLWPWLLSWS
jgi:hypothetical protein